MQEVKHHEKKSFKLFLSQMIVQKPAGKLGIVEGRHMVSVCFFDSLHKHFHCHSLYVFFLCSSTYS